jgi:hypothetical protein
MASRVHQAGQQLLVERAPIGPDAHRLAVLDRGLDDGAELPILLLLEADIAGIDAILVERFGTGRVLGQELVTNVVKVADDRHADAHLEQPLLDARHGGCRLVAVDGDAHDLRARGRQRRHLPYRLLDIGGVGIGHGLHDDGRATTHEHAAHIHGHRPAALLRPDFGHVWLLWRREVPDCALAVNAAAHAQPRAIYTLSPLSGVCSPRLAVRADAAELDHRRFGRKAGGARG